jgi:hypothetical protein
MAMPYFYAACHNALIIQLDLFIDMTQRFRSKLAHGGRCTALEEACLNKFQAFAAPAYRTLWAGLFHILGRIA